MSDKLYQKNIFKRSWDSFVLFMKSIPQSKANAVYIAVGFFVVLIAFMEYKVFESTYSLTKDLILSISVMGVTAFGGVIAEVFLRRNSKATDDQELAADSIFYISLAASAIAGFGIWAQASGNGTVNVGNLRIELPQFADFVFLMITVVTIADIFLLRHYIREDVDAKHRRNVERVQNRKRSSVLATDESLIEFEAEVERKVQKTLKIESRRQELVKSLKSMYGGSVPADVMEKAMRDLDAIKVADDLADDDKDGIKNKDDNTYNMPMRISYAAEEKGVSLNPSKPPR